MPKSFFHRHPERNNSPVSGRSVAEDSPGVLCSEGSRSPQATASSRFARFFTAFRMTTKVFRHSGKRFLERIQNRFWSPRKLVPRMTFFIVLLFLLLTSPALALTNPQDSGDITNSATIPTSSITAPVLRTPVDNSITNNRYEQFSWNTSTPTANISHYTLYLDGLIVESYIPHSNATNNIIYTTLGTPISDGEHTWYVIAYSTGSASAQSETHTFTVDATTPIIILQAVDKTTMYWASNDPFTIPPYNQRHLTVTTKNPLLSGKIEALSNFQLSLCQDLSSVSDRSEAEDSPEVRSTPCTSITVNDPDGEWKHRFRNLEPNLIYTAYLSATDAAGNSNIFPEFTITYTPAPLISLPFIPLFTRPRISPRTVPTARVTALPSAGSSEVESEIEPPPPPLPAQVLPKPEQKLGGPVIPAQAGTYLLLLLSIFGLLLHLSMTAFGAGIRPRLWPQLLWILFNPIQKGLSLKEDFSSASGRSEAEDSPEVRSGTNKLPFLTTILLYDTNTNKLLHAYLTGFNPLVDRHSGKQVFARIQNLIPESSQTRPQNDGQVKKGSDPNVPHFFLKATFPGYESFTAIVDPQDLSSVPLSASGGSGTLPSVDSPEVRSVIITLNPKPSLTPLEALQKLSLTTRSLPLGLSLITAIIYLISPLRSFSAAWLLIAGLDLTYTQYIHLKQGVRPLS